MKLLQASDICRGRLINLQANLSEQHCAMGWIIASTGENGGFYPFDGLLVRSDIRELAAKLQGQERIPIGASRVHSTHREHQVIEDVATWNNDESNPPGKIAAALNQLFATLDGSVQQDVIEPAKRELVTA